MSPQYLFIYFSKRAIILTLIHKQKQNKNHESLAFLVKISNPVANFNREDDVVNVYEVIKLYIGILVFKHINAYNTTNRHINTQTWRNTGAIQRLS